MKVKNLPARSGSEKLACSRILKVKSCLHDQEVPCTASFHAEIRIAQSLKQKCEIIISSYITIIIYHIKDVAYHIIHSIQLDRRIMHVDPKRRSASLQYDEVETGQTYKREVCCFLKLKVHLIPKILLTVA